jgi:hypothetical protein
MDEILVMTQEQFLIPLYIPNEDSVFRQAHIQSLKPVPGNNEFRFPRESHFKPHPEGLSVHWNRYISIRGVYHIISLSYKKDTTEYKDPKNFKLFSLPVGFIRSIDGVLDVKHSPVFNGSPAPIGFPNNYAHTSLLYPDDEEIRVKLSDYCKDNHQASYCYINFTLIEPEITALRERLDNTEYHNLPIQGNNLY